MENLVMIGLAELKSFYSGKKIWLSGHTGFKGAWLTLMLNELGAEVYGYALAPKTDQDLFNVAQVAEVCKHEIGDIRNKVQVAESIVKSHADIIFHLAAQPLVIDSYVDPIYTYETNVLGTAHVLDALRFVKKKTAAVIITTDKVYENKEHIYPYRETDRLGGFDPYSNSKACAELVTQSFVDSFFDSNKYVEHQKSVVTARSGNIIGGGDFSANRIIPDLARALSANEALKVRNPNAVRPWQHVFDPLLGYLILGMKSYHEPSKIDRAYNFGPLPQDELTVEQLVIKAIDYWGLGSYTPSPIKNAVHEAGLLKLDISKAIAELNWKPLLNSSEAIKITLDWYKHARPNYLEYSMGQINAFFSLIPA